VELYGDPEADATHPRKRGARVELHLANGEVRTGAKEDAHGTPADPCTDAEIEAKFRRLAGNALSANGIDRVLAAIRTLRDAPSVETLSNALRI
jgi:2-methylcitrate dehydratase PrpD